MLSSWFRDFEHKSICDSKNKFALFSQIKEKVNNQIMNSKFDQCLNKKTSYYIIYL